MTPEAQRIAIAEACGLCTAPSSEWKRTQYYVEYNQDDEFECKRCKERKESPHHSLPDYLKDLNVMHEAEKTLRGEQGIVFRFELAKNSDGKKAQFPTVEAAMCHATAAQRAEAFLRTIGKWEESK